MNEDSFPHDMQQEGHGNLKAYVIAFILSLILTFGAYFVAEEHLLESWSLVIVLLGLGILQMFVQLSFFLHLGKGTKPDWSLPATILAGLILVIVVAGSLWIMDSLNHRVMPKMEHK